MVTVPGVHRSDNGEPIEHRCLLRHVLAKQDAGQFGGDDFDGTTVLERAIGFGVPGVYVAGTAGHPEQNDRLAALDWLPCLGGTRPVAEGVH
jgi:hypothetical protein